MNLKTKLQRNQGTTAETKALKQFKRVRSLEILKTLEETILRISIYRYTLPTKKKHQRESKYKLILRRYIFIE